MTRKSLFFLLVFSVGVFAQNLSESSDFSYSIKLYNQEFYDLSTQQFIKFYTNYPRSAQADQAHYFAGMSMVNLGQYEKARIEFQSLAISFPKSEKAAEAWLKSGYCSEKLDEPDDAVKAYETIRLLYPKNSFAAEGLFRAGSIALDQNQPIKALQVFNVLIDQYSTSPYYKGASVKAARSLYLQQKFVEASQLLDKVLTQNPEGATKAEAYMIAAKIKREAGYTDQAQDYFQKVLDVKPVSEFHQQAYRELAQIYYSEKNYDKALEVIAKAGKDPQNVILSGDIHFLQGNYAKALSIYQKIELTSDNASYLIVQLKTALTLRFLDQKESARASLKSALETSEQIDSYLYSKVDSIYLEWLEVDKQYEAAVNHLTTNQETKSLRYSKIRLAHIFSKMGRWRDVISVLQPLSLVQENYPQKDQVLFLQAQAFYNNGSLRDAVHYYRIIVSDFAGSEYYSEADKAIKDLENYKLVDKDKAVEKLTDVTALMVNGAEPNLLQFQLGKVYLEDLKQFEKAEQQFLKALEANPGLAGDIHFYLAMTYFNLSHTVSENGRSAQIQKAMQQIKLSLKNMSTCTVPDQVSWMLVEQTIDSDTVAISQAKNLIESLINKYPQSALVEKWYSNLAFRLAYDNDNLNQSLKYFNVLIEQFTDSPQYPDYLFSYAQFQSQKEDAEALSMFKRIASEYPKSSSAPEALFKVAADYERNKQYSQALSLYRKLLSDYYYTSQAHEAKRKIGYLLVQTGSFKEALTSLKATESDPFLTDALLAGIFSEQHDFDNLFFIARSHEGLGQNDKALNQYKRYLDYAASGRFNSQSRFNMGALYFEKGNRQEAIDKFRSISSDEPDLYQQGQTYLAQLYFDAGNYKKAAISYRKLSKAEQDADKSAGISAQYVVSLIRSGQIAESKKAISTHKKQYKNQRNNSARFIVELADYYRLNKKFTKAVNLLNEVKKKYKKSDYVDDADYTIALINVTLNKIEDAFKILSNFYTNYPNSDRLAAALNTLGNLYFRTEKYDNAITMFKNALKARHDSELEANITSNLIKTYTLTGFWDAAQALARQYVNDFPNRFDVLDKKIIIAQGYINLNQFQNAVDYLKKIKLESDAEREPEIQFYIGEAYLKGGQYENAIAEFVKIPLLSKKTKLQWEASALFYSGQSYEKLGRSTDAMRMYQEIIDRPGIDLILKKEAQKRIKQIQ